jgi:hypothetical protein
MVAIIYFRKRHVNILSCLLKVIEFSKIKYNQLGRAMLNLSSLKLHILEVSDACTSAAASTLQSFRTQANGLCPITLHSVDPDSRESLFEQTSFPQASLHSDSFSPLARCLSSVTPSSSAENICFTSNDPITYRCACCSTSFLRWFTFSHTLNFCV